MTDEMKLSLLNKICSECELGKLEEQPNRLKGGFLHEMYSLFTMGGKYAVKLLNPSIMQRETAAENFRVAEKLEKILEQNDIPILPALIFHGNKMQCIEGQFFYVYDYYDGKALKGSEIREIHCRKIGQILAEIHKIDLRKEPYVHEGIHVDWDYYIKQFDGVNAELYKLLKENRLLLYESQKNGNAAIRQIPSVLSICHNDMDSKNVLWVGDEYRIIDLECLSYSSPIMELFELALCWSGYEECNLDYGRLDTFLSSYIEAGGHGPVDVNILYDSNCRRLEWLEYNVKRVLGVECATDEIEIGIKQVKDTMAHVIYYHDAKNEILDCLQKWGM